VKSYDTRKEENLNFLRYYLRRTHPRFPAGEGKKRKKNNMWPQPEKVGKEKEKTTLIRKDELLECIRRGRGKKRREGHQWRRFFLYTERGGKRRSDRLLVKEFYDDDLPLEREGVPMSGKIIGSKGKEPASFFLSSYEKGGFF